MNSSTPFSGSLKRPLISVAFSSTLVSLLAAVEPPVAPAASLSEPADFRIVEGTSPDVLTYNVADIGAMDQDLDFAVLPYVFGAHPAKEYGSLVSLSQPSLVPEDPDVLTSLSGVSTVGYTLNSGSSASLSVLPDITGLVAGDVVNLGVQMDGANWTAPVVSNTSINVVQNRLLTGSTTINAGRHMLGQIPGGTLTLDGGSLSGIEGTNIQVHSGGFAQYGNGVRLTSASDFTFNAAGQTHDLQIGYYGNAGNYNQSITLSGVNGADNYTDASGVKHNEFGGYWRTEVEVGSLLGNTETRVTGQQLSPYQVTGLSGISGSAIPEGSTAAIERNSNKVEFSQPSPQLEFDNGLLRASRAGGVQVNQRMNSLLSGEVIQGSSLDLSGVNLTVSGTALYNRQLSASSTSGNLQTYLGRQMVSATTQSVSQAGNITYKSLGADDQYTRVRLSDFSSNSGDGITAVYSGGDQDFTGVAGQEAVVGVTANFTVDRSATGTFNKTLNAGAGSITTLENGGAGLANESVQGGLNLTYTWANVENNQIDIKDQHVYLFDDVNLSSVALSADEAYNHGYGGLNNGPTHRVNSTNTHTAIGVNDAFQLHGSRAVGDVFEGTIAVNLGNGRVSGEGLSGESVIASDTFGVYTHTIGRADLDVTAPAGNLLDDGDAITVSNVDRALAGEQASVRVTPQSFEGSDRWTVSRVGNEVLAPGEASTMTAVFDGSGVGGAGELGGTFESVFTFETEDQFDIGSHFANLGVSDDRIADGGGLNTYATRQQHVYTFERVVEQVSASGSQSYGAGTEFGSVSPSLTNTGDNSSTGFAATSAAILGSETLESGTTVSMSFTKIEDAASTDLYGDKGGVSDFATDILDLTGLDGVMHVVELTYDDTVLTEGEGAMQVVWLTEYDTDPGAGESLQDIWVNAVLGNSDVVALDILGGTVTTAEGTTGIQAYLQDKRFSGSYESYLASLGGSDSDPELGAWGVHTGSNKVWAVIDHNSSFAGAVPEPSSIALLGLGGISLLLRRRR
ncbi:PEP-CTERM sorting domain-containing protein [Oceaniferula marina]|nr:PEP-CTERM sorting domain-containing protein [Oceaniferula marina]